MAFGRYGTALWLDNHAEGWFGGPSERGQRLAGQVLSLSSLLPYGCGRGSPIEGPEGKLGATAIGAEPTVPTSSSASMVFGTCDDDTWTRIAMDEEAGRIAIGHVDGAITLLEY